MKNSKYSRLSLAMLCAAILLSAELAWGFTSLSSDSGLVVFSPDNTFFADQRKMRDEQGKSLYDKVALYRNSNPPEKIWEKVFSPITNIYISKNARRMVLFSEHRTISYVPDYIDLKILNEKGEVIKAYTNQEAGFQILSEAPCHGADTIWDGSINISEDERTLTVGSIIRNLDEHNQKEKLKDICSNVWECRDKGIDYPLPFFPVAVWKFDLNTGDILSIKHIERESNSLFPQSQPRRTNPFYDPLFNSTTNNKISVDTDRQTSSIDSIAENKITWSKELDRYYPNHHLWQVRISADAKRAVLMWWPMQGNDLSQSKALTFIDGQGNILKEHNLTELADHMEFPKTRFLDFVWWGRMNDKIVDNKIEVVTFVKRNDLGLTEIKDFRSIVIYERWNPRPWVEDKILIFDVMTGELVSKEPINVANKIK